MEHTHCDIYNDEKDTKNWLQSQYKSVSYLPKKCIYKIYIKFVQRD